jgi:hypothetical protein
LLRELGVGAGLCTATTAVNESSEPAPIESLSATYCRYRAAQRRSHRACEQFPRSLLLASSIMPEDRRWKHDAERLNTWSPSAA